MTKEFKELDKMVHVIYNAIDEHNAGEILKQFIKENFIPKSELMEIKEELRCELIDLLHEHIIEDN